MNDLALTRLLQLASPMLPVGAYSYSQGLEWAIEEGIVHDAGTTRRWIEDALSLNLAGFEAPILLRLCNAWQTGDMVQVRDWNSRFLASRETSELRAETLQMGYSLSRLLTDLGLSDERLAGLEPVTYPTVFSFWVVAWAIPVDKALTAYLWSWAENQVSVAMKAVPIGQVAGQSILCALTTRIAESVERILSTPDTELRNFAPGLAIASSRHETQYSRLFRS